MEEWYEGNQGFYLQQKVSCSSTSIVQIMGVVEFLIFSIDLQKCATLSEVGILVQKLSPTNVDKLNRKLPISGGPQEV